jgi:hypothetical protein
VRRSILKEPEWVFTDNDDSLAGIALGSDATAEHEWGVKPMKQAFGLDESKDGIERRIIHTLPDDLRIISDKDFDAIFLTGGKHHRQAEDWLKDYELRRRGDDTLVCAWDEKSFGIVAYGAKDRVYLAALWLAFQRKDIAFWTQIGVFHSGGGLIFGIVSKISDEHKKAALDNDLDIKKMNRIADSTGIEKKLKAAGKNWHSLSPRWIKDFKEKTSRFQVIFWLNPCEQHLNNCGWFTVEELEQWIEGTGPIPKSNNLRKTT